MKTTGANSMTIPSITDDLLAEIESDFDPHRSNAEFMEAGEDWAPYIPLIIQRMRQLEKDAARYRKALCFYADPLRYHGANQRLDGPDEFTPESMPYRQDVTRDGGKIAIAAMQGDL